MPVPTPDALLLLLAPGGAVGVGSGSLALLALYVVLAIGVSFLCSVLEAVLLSVTPAYVGALAEAKPAAAQRLRTLKADVDRPLAAILSLNTVAHTIGAAGAGAEAAAYWGDAAVGVFSGVLTLGILILSEIIPKTLGAVYWRGLAPFVGRALTPLIWITYPLVLLSQGITKLIARGKTEGSVSREELAAMAQIGTQEGVFAESEGRILAGLFRFRDLTARDVMTPRTVVAAFDETTPLADVAQNGTPFSRLPLFRGDRDHVTGYVLRDDVLAAVADGRGDAPASSVARAVLSVPSSLALPALFEQLLDRREHLAVVVGEYGGLDGVVTVEDVIETLLGLEIVDEADHEMDLQAAARQRWADRARRLGVDPSGTERSAVVTHGLTGGVPPADPPPTPSAVDAERRQMDG